MTTSTMPVNFKERTSIFIEALMDWEKDLPGLNWAELEREARAGRAAVFCIDMIKGFCHEGVLASPRITGIIPAVVEVFNGAYKSGVRDFILAQDCHIPDALEFAAFPPHCQKGSNEAENIPELAGLPFADLYEVVTKNSLSTFIGTDLETWINEHEDLKTAIVVGDCTDLCVYHLAMHLRLYANAYHRDIRVIVPANAVQTYDMPVEVAKEISVLPHDGDVLHLVFLYHMRLNGIEVVQGIY